MLFFFSSLFGLLTCRVLKVYLRLFAAHVAAMVDDVVGNAVVVVVVVVVVYC